MGKISEFEIYILLFCVFTEFIILAMVGEILILLIGMSWKACTMVNTPIPHSLKSEAKKAAKILKDFTAPSAKAGPDKLIPRKYYRNFICIMC